MKENYIKQVKNAILMEQQGENEIRLPIGDKIIKYQEQVR